MAMPDPSEIRKAIEVAIEHGAAGDQWKKREENKELAFHSPSARKLRAAEIEQVLERFFTPGVRELLTIKKTYLRVGYNGLRHDGHWSGHVGTVYVFGDGLKLNDGKVGHKFLLIAILMTLKDFIWSGRGLASPRRIAEQMAAYGCDAKELEARMHKELKSLL